MSPFGNKIFLTQKAIVEATISRDSIIPSMMYNSGEGDPFTTKRSMPSCQPYFLAEFFHAGISLYEVQIEVVLVLELGGHNQAHTEDNVIRS